MATAASVGFLLLVVIGLISVSRLPAEEEPPKAVTRRARDGYEAVCSECGEVILTGLRREDSVSLYAGQVQEHQQMHLSK